MAGPRVPVHLAIRWPREQVEGFYGRPGLDLHDEISTLVAAAVEEAKAKHLTLDWGSVLIEGGMTAMSGEVRLTFYAEGEDTRDPLIALGDVLADAERARQRAHG